jgi:hypothetical protein
MSQSYHNKGVMQTGYFNPVHNLNNKYKRQLLLLEETSRNFKTRPMQQL